MRKTCILAAVVAMVAALLAVPGTALAKSDKAGPKKSTGYTCAQFKTLYAPGDDSFLVGAANAATFEVELASGETVCWDVSGTAAGHWTITAAPDGDSAVYVRNIALQIKDSIPGDLCYREDYWVHETLLETSFSTTVLIPEATKNACTDGDRLSFSDDADSLVFLAAASDTGPGKKSPAVGTVTITVTLPTN